MIDKDKIQRVMSYNNLAKGLNSHLFVFQANNQENVEIVQCTEICTIKEEITQRLKVNHIMTFMNIDVVDFSLSEA